jgi:broad specificity phosphatase PhoE
VFLIRHANPTPQRDVPARDWRLSEKGVLRARELASRLPLSRVRALHSSKEPKARETADEIARVWERPVYTVSDLHEHDRRHEPIHTPEEFDRRVRALFEQPAAIVFGAESADTARRRFTAAVMRLVLSEPGDVAVVTHGTVLALFVATATGQDPYALWKRLEMPCAVTLALPELTLEGVTSV